MISSLHRGRVAGALFGLAAFVIAPPAEGQDERTLLLALEHPSLEPSVLDALDQALREEAARVLAEGELLPRPALDLPSLTLAAGCPAVDDPCLQRLAETAAAQVLRIEVDPGSERDTMEITIATGAGRTAYRAAVHPVDAASGPELRFHLARVLGEERAPPPSRLEPRPPLPAGFEVWLDGKPVEASALEEVEPGPRRVELRGAGYEPLLWTGYARPGRTTFIPTGTLRLVEREPTSRPGPATAEAAGSDPGADLGLGASEPLPLPDPSPRGPELWGTAILGGASLATLGVVVPVLGLRVLEQEDAVLQAGVDCASTPQDAGCAEGRSRATATNIAIGVGVALAVSSIVAFVLEGGPSLLQGGRAASAPPPEKGSSARRREHPPEEARF